MPSKPNLVTEVLETAANRVNLRVDLEGHRGARICRAPRKSGPYEEVGVAYEPDFADSADLKPGKTYYYVAIPWNNPHVCQEPGRWASKEAVPAQIPRAPKERSSIVTRRRQELDINLGGDLDESNTATKGPEVYCPGPNSSMPPYEQVFEPNMYVAIENTGDTDVLNPWLVANGQRDWWSAESMVDELLRLVGGPRATDAEKMMAVWKFVVDEIYDSRAGMSWFDGMSDPVKLLNTYGFEGCVGNAIVCRRLAEAMGLKAREIWVGGGLDGHGQGRSCAHDIFEAHADGSWHFLDTDLMVFFLKRDNATVAGSEDIARDIDLLRRSHRNLGLCGRDLAEKVFYYDQFRNGEYVYPPTKGGAWLAGSGAVAHSPGEYPEAHTMGFRLRPGEKLVRYWDNVGKQVIRARRLHPEVRYSNGKLVYRPALRDRLARKGMESKSNLAPGATPNRPALHPRRVGQRAEAVWKVQSPYAIAGARVVLDCCRETQEDGVEVLLSLDGQNWRSVAFVGEDRRSLCVDLDWFLNPALNDWREERDNAWRVAPCYEYYVKVALWGGSRAEGAGLNSIWFDTDLQCSTRSLPSLFCGRNTISYRDDSRGAREVRVTYGWQEEHGIRPPGSPELACPEQEQDVDSLDFEFHWAKPKGRGPKVDDYHIQVSRYADFRWCVCPSFDRYVGRTAYAGRTCWKPQFPNLLNPDETYYWRVRARNSKGVWGKWSEVRSFTPHGPRHPVDLRVTRRKGIRVLTWKPNSNGNPPAEYQIHGSTESGGFSASEENLLAKTSECHWPLGKAARKVKTSYRVIAVDGSGVPSTPSDYVVS